MGQWDDEFGDQFKRDREDARLDKERATQEHRLVEQKGPELWKRLQEAANSAVTDINAARGQILTLIGPDPLSGKTGFEILYYRPDAQRKAIAKYTAPLYTLIVTFERDNKPSRNESFKVIAMNNNEVAFSSDGIHTPTSIVKKMLAGLL